MLIRRGAALTVLLLALAACGGGDDDDGGDAGASSSTEETGGNDAEPEGGGDCAGTDLSFTNLTTGESYDLTSTGAVSLAEGSAYTTYLADYELSEDDFGLAGAEVPADGNLVLLAVTVFNAEETPEPLEAGTEVTYTDEFGVLTFTVVHQQADSAFGNNTGAAGTVTITSVGDRFCAEVDYADDEKELSGTFEAEVIREF